MKKKPKNFRHIRTEIRAVIKKWRPILYLNDWYFDVVYPCENLNPEGGFEVTAEIHADPIYKMGKIWVFPAFFSLDPARREHAIVHELCHCVTQELTDQVVKLQDGFLVTKRERLQANERLTQMLTNIVVYQNGGKPCG